jgi:hypothetical protein
MIAGATEKRGGVDVTWHMFRLSCPKKKLRTTSNNVVRFGGRLGDEYEWFPGYDNLAAFNQRQPVR